MEWENYSMSELTNQALATIKDANHKKLLLSGVQILASLDPDHAAKRNGQGFDATDTHLGHSLARIDDAEKLTALQVVQCNNLCKKYFKQLPTEYWDLDEMQLDAGNSSSVVVCESESKSVAPITSPPLPVPAPLVPSLTLTDEQSHALELIRTWLEDLRPER